MRKIFILAILLIAAVISVLGILYTLTEVSTTAEIEFIKIGFFLL